MNFETLLVLKGKEGHEKNDSVVEEIGRWASNNGIGIREASYVDGRCAVEEVFGSFDSARSLLVTLGGDGTFLKGANLVAEIGVPVLGVNLGSLGFLAVLNSDSVVEGLEAVSSGDFSERNLLRLRAKLQDDKGTAGREFYALNEFVLSRRSVNGFTELALHVDSEPMGAFPGDGIIISTPTGSTAYSLAGGGPVLTPSTNALVVTPLNIHKLGVRPVICSHESEIEVQYRRPGVLMSDGDEVSEIQQGQKVTIDRSEVDTKVILPRGTDDFFSIMSEKLGWNLSALWPGSLGDKYSRG